MSFSIIATICISAALPTEAQHTLATEALKMGHDIVLLDVGADDSDCAVTYLAAADRAHETCGYGSLAVNGVTSEWFTVAIFGPVSPARARALIALGGEVCE